MGSLAGAIIGLGGVFKDDNERRYAIERKSHEELANLYFEMAKTARPEFAADLMKAGFGLMSLPPGKKPPKEYLDMQALMHKHIAKDYSKGAIKIKAPNPTRPPGTTAQASGYSERNIEPVPGSSDGMASGLASGSAPEQSGTPTGEPSMLDVLQMAQQQGSPQGSPQGSATPSGIPPGASRLPISSEPGSQAPSPVSGFPSPGFGPGVSPRKAAPAMPMPMDQIESPPMIPPPPIGDGLPQGALAGENDLELPPSWERELAPNEYIDPSDNERYANYKDLPRTAAQLKTDEMNARRTFAMRVLDLKGDDVVDFIQGKETTDHWQVSGDYAINTRTGEAKPITDANGYRFMSVGAGGGVLRTSKDGTSKVVYQAEIDPKIDPYKVAYAAFLRDHNGREPNTEEAKQIADDARAAQNRFSNQNEVLPNTHGEVASSVQIRSVPEAIIKDLGATKDIVQEFSLVERMLRDPRFSTKGPIWGRYTLGEIAYGGGIGVTPEQRQIALYLSDLLTKQAFQRGGTQLTETELPRFSLNTPILSDKLGLAVDKTKIALDVLRAHYKNQKSLLNAGMQAQVPDLPEGFGSLGQGTVLQKLEAPPPNPNRPGAIPSAAPATGGKIDLSKHDNRTKVK